MAESYTHSLNALAAAAQAKYIPRDKTSFLMGSNGPDPMFYYKIYNPFRSYNLAILGDIMHITKTGIFLKNLFLNARTDIQKDYCLGFLCHYALDSAIHPFVNYISQAYGSSFNIPRGHNYFETALDCALSQKYLHTSCPDLEEYAPEMTDSQLVQISYLLKRTVDLTYYEHDFPQEEYARCFKDFRFIRKFLHSPGKTKFPIALIIEKIIGKGDGFIMGRMQPCNMPMPDFSFWQDKTTGLYYADSLEDILYRADLLAAKYIDLGLAFCRGQISIDDFAEEIGNRSYDAGFAAY